MSLFLASALAISHATAMRMSEPDDSGVDVDQRVVTRNLARMPDEGERLSASHLADVGAPTWDEKYPTSLYQSVPRAHKLRMVARKHQEIKRILVNHGATSVTRIKTTGAGGRWSALVRFRGRKGYDCVIGDFRDAQAVVLSTDALPF